MSLLTESIGRVFKITINRPSDGNRWNGDVSQALQPILSDLANDTAHQVIVFTGAGAEFCLGSFNPAIRAGMAKADIVAFVMELNQLLDRLEALPQITIAAMNGRAHGSGVELSLACDLRYVSSATSIAFPEADMGGFPGAGAPVRLPQAVGAARALEMICTGRLVGAAELLHVGFAQGLFEAETFNADVLEISRRIASKGPLALRGAKRIVRTRNAAGFAEARMLSDQLRRELEWSADVDEALLAHKEGRAPNFKGF